MMKLMTVFALGLLVSELGAAGADLQKLSDQAVESCGPDIKKFCNDITPGKGRIASCLHAHGDKVSKNCTTAVGALSKEVDERVEKGRQRLNASCSKDIAKYCGRVPAGEGRILACLTGREDDLTDPCKSFMKNISTEIDDLLR